MSGAPELFDDADQLLLVEARARFEFEQKTAASLQSKSTFFLTLTGAFAGFIGTAVWKLLDKVRLSETENLAIGLYLVAFLILGSCTILLTRSVLSRSYKVIAVPSNWRDHLQLLRDAYSSDENCASVTYARLRFDILDAWVDAADAGYKINEFKATLLSNASKHLLISVPIVLIATAMLVVQR